MNNTEIEKEEIIKETSAILCTTDFEGYYPHVYLDTAGKETVACGIRVDDEKSFIEAPFRYSDTGKKISIEEKKELYKKTSSILEQEERNFYSENPEALYYNRRPETQLQNPDTSFLRSFYIDENDAVKMTENHLKKIYPEVEKEHKKYGMIFSEKPPAYRITALEMKYNMGNHIKLSTHQEKEEASEEEKQHYWPNFTEAIRNEDYFKASRNSDRLGVGKNRNEKTRRRLEEAQAQKYHKERYGTWK